MAQHEGEARFVHAKYPVEDAFARAVQSSVLLLGLEQLRAHHRCGGERNNQRDQDRDGQRHRELAEQSPHDAAHQQDWDKHGDQRDADREDGEADLPRATQRRFHWTNPLFDIAGDIFNDHDRIIDDEAGRNRQGHEREVVETIAEQIHDTEGAD